MLRIMKVKENTLIRYGIVITLVFSGIGEFFNIPFLEINQFFLVLVILICLIRIKTNPSNYVVVDSIQMVVIALVIYLILQGFILTSNYMEYMRFAKNYILAFSFILIIMTLEYSEYLRILKVIVYFLTVLFFLEYILWQASPFLYGYMFAPLYDGIRHMANFLSPNSYAIVLAFLITYYVNRFVQAHKFINIIVGIGLCLPLATTYSKSGLIVCVVGVFFCLWFSENKFYKGIAIIGVIIFSWLLFSNLLITFLELFPDSYYARRLVLYLESETLGGERADTYLQMIHIFQDNWIGGVGFGNLTESNEHIIGFSSPHNEYLRFFAEGGIVGGILFSLFIASIAIQTLKWRKSSDRILIIWGILFIIAEIFYNYLNAPREGLILIFFGCGCLLINNEQKFMNHKNGEYLRENNEV